LGVVGAALMLLALGKPMGFVAMLGIIALNGMIIRNSVILIDQIEQDIANGTWTVGPPLLKRQYVVLDPLF
jgi:multidrug efflux pump